MCVSRVETEIFFPGEAQSQKMKGMTAVLSGQNRWRYKIMLHSVTKQREKQRGGWVKK